MKVLIDVVDGACALRRRRLAVRAEIALLSAAPDDVVLEVRDFAEVSKWQGCIPDAGDPSLRYLLLLHASSAQPDWEEAVRQFRDTFTFLRRNNYAVLQTYSGSAISVIPADAEESGTHATGVHSIDDFERRQDAVIVGDEGLDVEDLVGRLLSGATTASHGSSGEVPLELEANVRHGLVNTIKPLLIAASAASKDSHAVHNFEVLRERLIAQMDKVGAHLPRWAQLAVDRIDKLESSRLSVRPVDLDLLDALVVDLGRLHALSRDIGRGPALSVEMARSLRHGWSRTPRVLWIEDEQAWFLSLGPILKSAGIDVAFAGTPEQAADRLQSVEVYDAVILDVILQGWDVGMVARALTDAPTFHENDREGISLLTAIRGRVDAPPVYMLSARDSSDIVARCIRGGAAGYTTKSALNLTEFVYSLQDKIRARDAQRAQAERPMNPNLVVGEGDTALREVLRKLDAVAVARVGLPIVLTGEPGVGKEELVEEFTRRSGREDYVTFNCAAVREGGDSAEHRLFGHVEGVFANTKGARPGVIEEADGKVLFIDELDKLDPSLQKRLLEVIEAREVVRLGDTKPRSIDVKIVLASNEDIGAATKEGKFLAALASRLTAFRLYVPSLRERASIVPTLVPRLMARISHDEGLEPKVLTDAALDWLVDEVKRGRFDGEAGNIRGLRDLLKMAVILNPAAAHIDIDALIGGQEGDAVTDDQESIVAAGVLLARYLVDKKDIPLQRLEKKLRASVIEALVKSEGRTRSDLGVIFGLSKDGVRQILMRLRDDGLLGPDI